VSRATGAEVLIARQEEFPGATAPDLIVYAEGLLDMSWHNDVCPQYGVEQVSAAYPDVEVCLWVDWLNDERREAPGGCRYLVNVYALGTVGLAGVLGAGDDPWVVHESDDANDALHTFVSTLASVRLHLARLAPLRPPLPHVP
jgi:hypothetical protein